jgi:hypothetical protein
MWFRGRETWKAVGQEPVHRWWKNVDAVLSSAKALRRCRRSRGGHQVRTLDGSFPPIPGNARLRADHRRETFRRAPGTAPRTASTAA